jgi:hypothetical protein
MPRPGDNLKQSAADGTIVVETLQDLDGAIKTTSLARV